jgi:OOP family OmpA-OmpF porin
MGKFNKQFKLGMLSAIVSSLVLLQGCATSVSRLSEDGKSDEIIFPNIEKSAWIKEGVFPNIENLRNVVPDMTKDQLYSLLGHPHFSEGMGKVREWDYIFNFRKNGSTEVDTCQYKIIYTSSMRLQSTYWKPETCAHWLDMQAAQAQTVVEKTVEKLVPGPEITRMQMRPGGVEKLNRVSTDLLSGGEIVQLKIVGHTDRLGDDAYNMKLSQARADTIRQYLVAKNIPAERITALGVGKTVPIVECKQSKRDDILIRCLEPNRRFEIEAWTVRKM